MPSRICQRRPSALIKTSPSRCKFAACARAGKNILTAQVRLRTRLPGGDILREHRRRNKPARTLHKAIHPGENTCGNCLLQQTEAKERNGNCAFGFKIGCIEGLFNVIRVKIVIQFYKFDGFRGCRGSSPGGLCDSAAWPLNCACWHIQG